MDVLQAKPLPVGRLRPNPDNPKAPIAKAYVQGLREAIARYGFCGTLGVAKNKDGTYTVLDGNTRLAELKEAGVAKAYCYEVAACEEGAPGWEHERKKFVLAYDRNRKKFDDLAVLDQLRKLAEAGQDAKALARLTARSNLERLLQGAAASAPAAARPLEQQTMASLVLYGPASAIKDIADLLKQVRGKLSQLERAKAALAQAARVLDWTDEALLAVLLATAAAFGRGDNGGAA